MNVDIILTLLSVGVPVLAGVIAYIFKSVIQRIDKVEKTIEEGVTENQVRQILTDKIDPIKEDISQIRVETAKILDLYINSIKNRYMR